MRVEFHILLIEDSPTDAQIIERALREHATPHRLTVISDGRRALEVLTAAPATSAGPEIDPDLILLDLNLPGMDGNQVLASIKGHPTLRSIPVVVLTTSRREEDVLRTYQAGANTYIEKPAEYDHYCDLIATLRTYWHDTAVRRPRRRHRAS
jgi:chemotaxis family two-component system response regulator Rcp1